MTLSDFFAKCGTFMLEQGGTVYKVFNHATKSDGVKPMSSVFFTPFESAPNFFYRAGCVVTSPVCLSLLAIELAAASFYLSLSSLVRLATLNPQAAKTRITDSLIHFVVAVVAAIAAFLSPFVNFVDFVGACVTSALPKKDASQEVAPEASVAAP